jgi:GNAT superfamily N-acetyltransferase
LLLPRYFSKPQFQKDGFFLVKHDDDFIATAFAWLDEEAPSQGIMHWLAVLPEHRRKGIAQSLCHCVLKYHKDHGKTMALLKTEVYRKHALQLYDKLGFTKTLQVLIVGILTGLV